MLPFEYYSDKPQTYVKHFFLEHYLERVAFNIFHSKRNEIDFAYIDGFSGPWRSKDESLKDTSFAIALKKLKDVRSKSFQPGKTKSLRCLFVESNPKSYADLEAYLSQVKGASCSAINDEFEAAVDKIVEFVGQAFSFCFIDPTGFSGFPIQSMKPILDLRGEFLINFMYTFINKHLSNEDDETRGHMDALFGGGDWRAKIIQKQEEGLEREDAIIETYCERLKEYGRVKYVTSTRVLFGTADRTYFYLVYGTNHRKGLMEFREIESKAVLEQERVRTVLKYQSRANRTGFGDLLAPLNAPISETQRSFDDLKARNLTKARQMIEVMLVQGEIVYDDCLDVLEIPYIWVRDLKAILGSMAEEGLVKLVHENPNGRVPKSKTKIIRL